MRNRSRGDSSASDVPRGQIDEACHLQGRLARRPAGRRLARPGARPIMRPASRAGCSRCSTTGTSCRRSSRTCTTTLEQRQGAPRVPVRSGAVHGAAAARLPVGRRLGLHQPRRAGARGAQRRDAGELLHRPADVPGRQRRLPRPVRRRRRAAARTGASTSRPRSRSSPATSPMGADARAGARRHPPGDARQRREPAQPDPGRTRQGLRLLPEQAGDRVQPGRRDARRARRRLAAAAACTSTLQSTWNGAQASACATPARR